MSIWYLIYRICMALFFIIITFGHMALGGTGAKWFIFMTDLGNNVCFGTQNIVLFVNPPWESYLANIFPHCSTNKMYLHFPYDSLFSNPAAIPKGDSQIRRYFVSQNRHSFEDPPRNLRQISLFAGSKR